METAVQVVEMDNFSELVSRQQALHQVTMDNDSALEQIPVSAEQNTSSSYSRSSNIRIIQIWATCCVNAGHPEQITEPGHIDVNHEFDFRQWLRP
jgi:hypothetical protein